MLTASEPVGQEVQTPPCFVQKEHEQALAAISFGSGCQSSLKEMFPQWQAPEMSMMVRPWCLRRLTFELSRTRRPQAVARRLERRVRP